MSNAVQKYSFIQKLHESANSLVYRGHQSDNNRSVILKVLQQSYLSPEKRAWFKQEYETTQNLDIAGVVKAYNLENYQNKWVMVLEDFGGESLNRLIEKSPFPPAQFLPLAIKIVEIIGQVHQQHVIHKDINPSNLVWNQETEQVKLIDFGISTVLSRENTTFRNPNLLQGTLAYISPEQTGRMNRSIDYRTDFYSLGVTFYEILTGRLPFPTEDALELIHCHIARQPVLPHECKPDIPPVISQIVGKLMAKNPEDRYQSTSGLKVDLEECLKQWQTKEQIDSFPLNQHDVCDRLQIPQKLYGREREIATLMATIEGVSQGNSQMILVSGYSGIGKSALIQELYKPLTRQRGYFISGKFDQLKRDIPYASIIQAFKALVGQLLTESQTAIANWRQKLLDALGNNGRVIAEVIPEVELIIGQQPEIPILPPTETQNRFNLVFQKFIKVFTQPEHILVMFLDDLQWADAASLKLIQLLMTTTDSQYLCLIGAYRDNEVSPAHPLRLTLDEIKQHKATIEDILLSPLTLSDVIHLIVDTFRINSKIAKPLAELVRTKTEGNPFFINEFLKSLYVQKLIAFDYEKSCWQWDLGKIKAKKLADNVVELMIEKVKKIPLEAQNILKLSACIGNRFDLEMLAIVSERSPRETAINLWVAISEGLILPLNDTYKLMELDVEGISEQLPAEYKFAHDRIQQAAYSLISEVDKQRLHLHLGWLLLHKTPLEEREKKLFNIVNQFNEGWSLIERQVERNQLAELNLQAGQKAKTAAAYQSAFNYFKIGLELLGKDSWQAQYQLTLELHLAAAEAAFLNADFEEMQCLINRVLQKSQTLLEKVKVYDIGIQARMSQNQHLEAIELGLQILNLLGVTFPEQPNQEDIILAMQETQSVLANKQIEDLINLPSMTDSNKLAAMKIMTVLWSPVFIAMNNLVPLMACKQINFSIEYGNAPDSAFAYANYSFFLCMGQEIKMGQLLSQLAIDILEKFNVKRLKARTYIFYGFVKHFTEHLRDMQPFQLEAYHSGLESGDFDYASSGALCSTMSLYFSGKELTELEQEMAARCKAITQLKQEAYNHWQRIYWQAVLNWLGRTENPQYLQGEVYDDKKMQVLHLEANDRTAFMHLYINKLILCYSFQELQQAFETAVQLEAYIIQAGSTFIAPPGYFYDSLTRLAVFPDMQPSEQERILKKVAANQEKMALWAKHAPMNYLHKFYLVEAERARVLCQYKDAREYYDRAITLANENEYLNEEALACELAGRFYLARSQDRVARHYLQDAHYTYHRWGAVAKVKDLETRYPQFLTTSSKRKRPTKLPSPTISESETSAEIFDFHSVLRASQTISSEILLNKLLEKLIEIAIENAGAQMGFLILEQEKELFIEAEIDTNQEEAIARNSEPVKNSQKLPLSIVNYVQRTRETVVVKDATHDSRFTKDPYL
ncbi:MAG: serine/threonine-protein kinase PknK, partial [Cyanobacteria bacterium SBLK]|nr:serine/threonine-protein kinase PknK [Cyanobacteria bacterium SBLK]